MTMGVTQAEKNNTKSKQRLWNWDAFFLSYCDTKQWAAVALPLFCFDSDCIVYCFSFCWMYSIWYQIKSFSSQYNKTNCGSRDMDDWCEIQLLINFIIVVPSCYLPPPWKKCKQSQFTSKNKLPNIFTLVYSNYLDFFGSLQLIYFEARLAHRGLMLGKELVCVCLFTRR